MDNFKTFQEDLASGRPAKKPVSSNLLKQRAKDNEKALKSGFMKMPDYVKKKFNEEEEMKPHKMYKGDKVVVAKNKAEHDKLNKQGYTHDDPKTKKVEESTRDNYNPVTSAKRTKEKLKKVGLPTEPPIVKEDKNWPRPFTKDERQEFLDKAHKEAGYKKVSGTGIKKVKGGYARKTTYTKEEQMAEAKKPVVHFKGKDSLKTVKIKYNKPIKTKVTDIGPGGKEVVRKDWSEGIERDPKSNSFNRTKRKETTVRVGQKRDKKTGKMVDVMGKSSAPQGLPTMREQQMQLVTNLDFNEGLTNLVSRGLDKVRSSIKDAEKRTGLKVDASKQASNPVSGKNIAKRLYGNSQKKRKN